MIWKLNAILGRDKNATQPDADTCFSQGLEHVSRQEWREAQRLFEQATRLRPGWADAHAALGSVRRQTGELEAALAAYDQAIVIDPKRTEVWFNRGTLLTQAGELADALKSFERVMEIDPGMVPALARCGDLQWQMGNLTNAEEAYRRASSLSPGNPEIQGRLGALLSESGRHTDAVDCFERAIIAAPAEAAFHAGRGLALMALRRWEDSLASFDAAVQLRSDFARAYSSRGQVLAQLGDLPGARSSHERAVQLSPNDAQLHYNRGAFFSDRLEWESAALSFQAATTLAPQGPDAFCNLGLSQQELGHYDLALASYTQALAINPQLAAAYNNRGNLYRASRRFVEAKADYSEALRLEPAYAEAHYNSGQLALLMGHLEQGWPEYEWRNQIEEARAVSTVRRVASTWPHGASLQGKRIHLYAEQGLGDTLQFCRYAPALASRGANVTLEVQAVLVELLSQLDGVARCMPAGTAAADADYACSLMSLPGLMGTTMATIPARVPYLRAAATRVEHCRASLASRTRPRIGLAWSGNPQQRNDRQRSMALAQLIRHLPGTFDYFCLQKDVREADKATMLEHPAVHVLEPMLVTLSATAALVETMDLVISVDTSIAHLSGAMAKPTWILLPFVPDWRWLLDRSDSPWYPTVTLYRQPVAGDWESVLAQVERDLGTWNRMESNARP